MKLRLHLKHVREHEREHVREHVQEHVTIYVDGFLYSVRNGLQRTRPHNNFSRKKCRHLCYGYGLMFGEMIQVWMQLYVSCDFNNFMYLEKNPEIPNVGFCPFHSAMKEDLTTIEIG
jgi:hypothetical protein